MSWLIGSKRVGPAFIAPGRPWQNGYSGSFHGRLGDECLNRDWFHSGAGAAHVIETWRQQYNTQRPHSSLGYRTPAQVAAEVSTHWGRPAGRSLCLASILEAGQSDLHQVLLRLDESTWDKPVKGSPKEWALHETVAHLNRSCTELLGILDEAARFGRDLQRDQAELTARLPIYTGNVDINQRD